MFHVGNHRRLSPLSCHVVSYEVGIAEIHEEQSTASTRSVRRTVGHGCTNYKLLPVDGDN